MNEVVITGIGMRTPLGHDYAGVRAAFERGEPVIRPMVGPQGQVRAYAKTDLDITAGFSRLDISLLDPFAMFAQHAADAAVRDSGLDLAAADRDRIGVYLGTGQGATATAYEAFTDLALRNRCRAYSILQGLFNGAANEIAIRHGLRGPCETTVLACSASNAAMGAALRAIRLGEVDLAVTGGAEATFNEGAIRAWEAMRVLAKLEPGAEAGCCRPFDRSRSGLALGDGAVFYVFENAAHARARGAHIHARVIGYGASCDATHITAPDAAGQALALTRCLRDAGLTTADVGYINAHGTATPAGDPVEVQSLKTVLGSHAAHVPVSATKSLHGHLLGAAGAIELLAALVAVQDGIIAPTANLHDPDDGFDLDFVPLVARTGVEVETAISTSFAFGGSNACLAIARA